MVVHVGSKRVVLLLLAALACGMNSETHAQGPERGDSGRSQSSQKATKVFEDSEVKIVIPGGWSIVAGQQNGRLILEKRDYRLLLAYDTGHAGPVESGRFLEAFDLPWPDIDDGSTCSLYFDKNALPASRVLVFKTLIVDTSKTDVQKNCGIPKDLGHSTEEGDVRDLNGERRWFGGYFTTAGGGVFF